MNLERRHSSDNRRSRETEVERQEARLEKDRKRVADRRARETQEEKESRREQDRGGEGRGGEGRGGEGRGGEGRGGEGRGGEGRGGEGRGEEGRGGEIWLHGINGREIGGGIFFYLPAQRCSAMNKARLTGFPASVDIIGDVTPHGK